ncbi:tetratricopeptide repeat-containing sensor histidine kinase [Polaribacter sargassicola]|uniref:tetratricopeptide repeat-containing sensor histidine kinase n=1 Tax=Polaribacter sargassicola TaxID=2836891 RepID=UPI001F305160|nr:tetratricopeptide repeat-containing sensor histidine kinase [Polaribacter sp. DS7-9]MCG1035059.1 tetratricopeptide repeat protein [Polaribacter sp. DS7-9]
MIIKGSEIKECIKKSNFFNKNKKAILFLLLITNITLTAQDKVSNSVRDSTLTLLNEYTKTNQPDLPTKAFLFAEQKGGDTLIRNTYINFGIKSYFAKDLSNLVLSEKKLKQFYLKTKDTMALAKHLYFKGLYHKLQFNPDSSFYYYNESKNFSVQLKDSLEATRRLLSMAALQYDERDYLGSENSIIEGLRFVEPLGNLFFTGLLYERLGNVLFITGREKEARKNYLKFFELQKQTPGLVLKYEEARLYNHLGNTYEAERNNLKAVEYFKKSLAIDSLKFNSVYRYESALAGLSYNNFILGENKLALKGFLEVLKSRKDRNYKRGLVITHSNLSDFYIGTNDVNNSKLHAEKSLELAKSISFNRYILENLARLSSITKGEKGRLFLEEYRVLNDSLVERERFLKNQFAKVRYETEKKEAENVHLKEENSRKELLLETEKQHKIIGWLIAGFCILIIFFGISVVLSRRKKMLFKAQLLQVEVREKERQQIAKSLHDEVAGDIRMLHLKLSKTNQLEEAEKLNVIKENVRNLSHQLSSESFDKVSFKDQIINLISDYFDFNFRIKAKNIDDVDWTKVNNAIKRTLFLSVRESIQNAKKYAEATELILNFSETKKTVLLVISDNGKGFDVKARKTGIGLKNLEERILEINGTFSLESDIGKGTTIKIETFKNEN